MTSESSPEPRTILIFGGAGVFGAGITEGVLATTTCRVVVASRTDRHREDVAMLAERYGSDRVTAALADRGEPEAIIATCRPFCVIDAAGPFQHSGFRVLTSAIAHGSHYIDIADAREFVAAFPSHDRIAKEAGVLALTGASSTPSLSHAALDALTEGWRSVDRVDIAIAPGNRAPRGLSVLRAILSWVGRPVRVKIDGLWTTRPGWGELQRYAMPGLGPRWLSLCETPDLDLVAARYPTAQTVLFKAGLEVPVLHVGLFALMQAVRFGVVSSLVPFAPLLLKIANGFNSFGTDRGGMSVRVSGLDATGTAVTAEWSLLAAGGDGPRIPGLPVLAHLRALLDNRLTLRGAMPAVGLLDLAAMEAEFWPFAIRTSREVHHAPEGLFPSLPASNMAVMPDLIRDLHAGRRQRLLRGQVEVLGATNPVGRCMARLIGLPCRSGVLPAVVSLKPGQGEEIWTRRFGSTTFRSRLRASGSPCGVSEQFGLIIVDLRMVQHRQGFDLTVVGWRLGGLPLPRALAPQSKARAFIDQNGRYGFDVAIALPFVGRLAHYRGWLLPDA